MERIQPVVLTPFPLHPLLWAEFKVISNLVVCIDTPEASVISSFPLIDKLLPELPASFSMVTKPPISFNPSLCLPCSPSPPPSSMGSLVVSFHSPLGSSFTPPFWRFFQRAGNKGPCRRLLPFSLSALFLLFTPLLWRLLASSRLSSSNTFLSVPPQTLVPPPASG